MEKIKHLIFIVLFLIGLYSIFGQTISVTNMNVYDYNELISNGNNNVRFLENIDIFLDLSMGLSNNRNLLNIGNIINGTLNLSLPENIGDEYLVDPVKYFTVNTTVDTDGLKVFFLRGNVRLSILSNEMMGQVHNDILFIYSNMDGSYISNYKKYILNEGWNMFYYDDLNSFRFFLNDIYEWGYRWYAFKMN